MKALKKPRLRGFFFGRSSYGFKVDLSGIPVPRWCQGRIQITRPMPVTIITARRQGLATVPDVTAEFRKKLTGPRMLSAEAGGTAKDV